MINNIAVRLLTASLIVTSLLSAGCAWWDDSSNRVGIQDVDLINASYQAADNLLNQTAWLREQRQPLLTATFVDVNALENSSSLGRIIAEQISSRFAQQGFTMVEMKLRDAVFIKQQAGEFMLSRSVIEISQHHNAAAVIAGTYAVGRHSVYVSARLIRATDNLILAGYDYSLPMGPDTKALLASQ